MTASSLNIREGPGTNFKAIGTLLRNDIVEALGFNADVSWIRIRRFTDGLTGWASATFLEKTTTQPPPPPPPTGDKYRVMATRLNVREGPGTEFSVVGILQLNEIVTSIGVNPDGTWRQIRRSDGLTGWSSAQYLVLAPPAPPPPDSVSGNWYRANCQLNVRNGAGTNFNVIGMLNKDEIVEALNANADQSWIRSAAWMAGQSGPLLIFSSMQARRLLQSHKISSRE